MSDLISREDAVALVIKAIHGTDNKEIQEYLFDGLRKQMWSLPSAESTGAMDEAIQEYIKDGYMQPIGEDLISRQDAIDCVRWGDNVINVIDGINALPSADRPQGEWIKEKRVYGISKPFCSRCGAVALSEMINLGSYKTCKSNFCPNCGADMRGEEE